MDEGRHSLPPTTTNRLMPHRHHTSMSSDLSASIGLQSEAVSATPSEMAVHEQYETIKEEPNADLYENTDNNRKMSLSPDIQYWFEQKKKIDQLLLPLPEKRTSSPNVSNKVGEKTKTVYKPTNGRTNSITARNSQPTAVNASSPLQVQLQAPSMSSGEHDFSGERHFTKKIFDDGGKISARDLKDAFATFQNKHFSDGVCKFVVRLFDLDRNGGLDIKEFEQLYSYIKLWVSAYHVYDRHHAGYLTEKDFHNALKHMDIHFSPEFISFLVTRCDPINRRISLSQFIVTCVQIQKYTDEFKNRDDNYSGTINLRYEDFLEMVLRCL